MVSPASLRPWTSKGVFPAPLHIFPISSNPTTPPFFQATVGIIGFGKIGQATLHRLLGFGISRALYTTSVPGLTLPASKDYFSLLRTPSPHPLVEIRPAVSLTELAEESDFVILACGLTPETHHLVDGDFLKKMKKKAYVINVGRGACVDEKALLAAVAEGRISGAGLDVVEGEPNIPSDHPLVRTRFPHFSEILLTVYGYRF